MAAVAEGATRKALFDRMARARQETDSLFELVQPESLYERPIAERHRIVFYVGHLEPSTGTCCNRGFRVYRFSILRSTSCLPLE